MFRFYWYQLLVFSQVAFLNHIMITTIVAHFEVEMYDELHYQNENNFWV